MKYFRNESRNTGGYDYLSPQSNGYKNAYESRSTDANGMRHEGFLIELELISEQSFIARREQFREEIRRTGSQQSVPIPVSPRSDSRQSGLFIFVAMLTISYSFRGSKRL